MHQAFSFQVLWNFLLSLLDTLVIFQGSYLFKGGWGNIPQTGRYPEPKPVDVDRVEWVDEWQTHNNHDSRQCKFKNLSSDNTLHCMIILPSASKQKLNSQSIVILLPTLGGDPNMTDRMSIARILVDKGLGCIIPQLASNTSDVGFHNTVHSMMMFNYQTVCQVLTLVNWLHNEASVSKICVAGTSMGSHLAGSVAAHSTIPIACAMYLPLHSGSALLEGCLSPSISWHSISDSKTTESKLKLASLFDQYSLLAKPVPVCTKAIVLLSGKYDRFVDSQSPRALNCYWKGSCLRWINTGHAAGAIFHSTNLVDAILESLSNL